MAVTSEHGKGFAEAKAVLRRLGPKAQRRSEAIRLRLQRMLVSLDAILTSLPEDVTQEVLGEVDRIVVTLHTADASWSQGAFASASQSIELAGARIDRLARSQVQGLS